jgi:hypothetical protein
LGTFEPVFEILALLGVSSLDQGATAVGGNVRREGCSGRDLLNGGGTDGDGSGFGTSGVLFGILDVPTGLQDLIHLFQGVVEGLNVAACCRVSGVVMWGVEKVGRCYDVPGVVQQQQKMMKG